MESYLMVSSDLNYLIFHLLLPYITHFDGIIVLPLLVFETLRFIPSVFFYTLNNEKTDIV